MTSPHIRIAIPADIPAIQSVLDRAIGLLQQGFLDAAQIAASRRIMGLDTQLILDGTYFVAELDGVIAGCGGWSRRATLYGGDHSIDLRDATLLDPAHDAARIRAMFTDPDCARRGVGTAILSLCETSARAEGFRQAELMATLAGEPLYRACGYTGIEQITDDRGGAAVPLVRMAKRL